MESNQNQIRRIRESKEYKNYKSSIDKVLKIFENTEEWPDLISVLAKLQKLIQTYTSIPIIPRKFTIGKRLAQCLHPALPSGVHLKTLQIYDLIFDTIGSDNLYKDSSIYLCGIYPLFPKASLAIKPFVLELYEKHLVIEARDRSAPRPSGQVGQSHVDGSEVASDALAKVAPVLRPILVVEPSLMGLFMGTFPGIDPGSEFLPKFYKILNTIYEGISDRVYFLECLWTCIYSSPSSRLGALNYLLENRGRYVGNLMDAWHNTDRKIIVRAMCSSLRDNQLLVRRTALDILNSMMPLDKLNDREPLFQDSGTRSPIFHSLRLIMYSVLGILLDKNSAMNKRVFTWIFSSPTQKKLSTSGANNGRIVGGALYRGDKDRSNPHLQKPVPAYDYGSEKLAAPTATTAENEKRHKRTGSKDDTYYLVLKRTSTSDPPHSVVTSSSAAGPAVAYSSSDTHLERGGAPDDIQMASFPSFRTGPGQPNDTVVTSSSSSSSSVATSSSSGRAAGTPGRTNVDVIACVGDVTALTQEREYSYARRYAIPLVLACWRESRFLHPSGSETGIDRSPFLFLLTLVDATETGPGGTINSVRSGGHRRKGSSLTAKEPFMTALIEALAFEIIEYGVVSHGAKSAANELDPGTEGDGSGSDRTLSLFRSLLAKRGADIVRFAQSQLLTSLASFLRDHVYGKDGEGTDRDGDDYNNQRRREQDGVDHVLGTTTCEEPKSFGSSKFVSEITVWAEFTDMIYPQNVTNESVSALNNKDAYRTIFPKSHSSKVSLNSNAANRASSLWTIASFQTMYALLTLTRHHLPAIRDAILTYRGPLSPHAYCDGLQVLDLIISFTIRSIRLNLALKGVVPTIGNVLRTGQPQNSSFPETLDQILTFVGPVAEWISAQLVRNPVQRTKVPIVDRCSEDAPDQIAVLFFDVFNGLLFPGSTINRERPAPDSGDYDAIGTDDDHVTGVVAPSYGGDTADFTTNLVPPTTDLHPHEWLGGTILEKLCVAHYYFYVKYIVLGDVDTPVVSNLDLVRFGADDSQQPPSSESMVNLQLLPQYLGTLMDDNSPSEDTFLLHRFCDRVSLYLCMAIEQNLSNALPPNASDDDDTQPIQIPEALGTHSLINFVMMDVWKNMGADYYRDPHGAPNAIIHPLLLLTLHDYLRTRLGEGSSHLDALISRDLNSRDQVTRKTALVKMASVWSTIPLNSRPTLPRDSPYADGAAHFLPRTILSIFGTLMHQDDSTACPSWEEDTVLGLTRSLIEKCFGPSSHSGPADPTTMAKLYFLSPLTHPILQCIGFVKDITCSPSPDPPSPTYTDVGSFDGDHHYSGLLEARFIAPRHTASGEESPHHHCGVVPVSSGAGSQLRDQNNFPPSIKTETEVDDQGNVMAIHSCKHPQSYHPDSFGKSGDEPPPSPQTMADIHNGAEIMAKSLSQAFLIVPCHYDYQQISFSLRIFHNLLSGAFTQGSLTAIPEILMTPYPTTSQKGEDQGVPRCLLDILMYACLRIASSHHPNNESIPSSIHDDCSVLDFVIIRDDDSTGIGTIVIPRPDPKYHPNDDADDTKFLSSAIKPTCYQELTSHNNVRLGAVKLLDTILEICLDFRETHPRLYERAWEAIESYRATDHILSILYLVYYSSGSNPDPKDPSVPLHPVIHRSDDVATRHALLCDIIRYNDPGDDYRVPYVNHLTSALLSLALMSSPSTPKDPTKVNRPTFRLHYLLHDILIDVRYRLCLARAFSTPHPSRSSPVPSIKSSERHSWIRFLTTSQLLVTSLQSGLYGPTKLLVIPGPCYASLAGLYLEMVTTVFAVTNEICHDIITICRNCGMRTRNDVSSDIQTCRKLLQRFDSFLAHCYAMAANEVDPVQSTSRAHGLTATDLTPKIWNHVVYHTNRLTALTQLDSRSSSSSIFQGETHANGADAVSLVGPPPQQPKVASSLFVSHVPLYLECLINCAQTFSYRRDVGICHTVETLVEKYFTGDSKIFFEAFLLASVLRYITITAYPVGSRRPAIKERERGYKYPDPLGSLVSFYATISSSVGDTKRRSSFTISIALGLVKLLVKLLKNQRLGTVLTASLKQIGRGEIVTKELLIAGTLEFLSTTIVAAATRGPPKIATTNAPYPQISHLLVDPAFSELSNLLKGSPFTLQLLRCFHNCLTQPSVRESSSIDSGGEEGEEAAEGDSPPSLTNQLRDAFQKIFDATVVLGSGAITSSSWILFKKTSYVIQMPRGDTIPCNTASMNLSNVRIRKSGLASNGTTINNNNTLLANGITSQRPKSMGEVHVVDRAAITPGARLLTSLSPQTLIASSKKSSSPSKGRSTHGSVAGGTRQQYTLSPTKKKKRLLQQVGGGQHSDTNVIEGNTIGLSQQSTSLTSSYHPDLVAVVPPKRPLTPQLTANYLMGRRAHTHQSYTLVPVNPIPYPYSPSASENYLPVPTPISPTTTNHYDEADRTVCPNFYQDKYFYPVASPSLIIRKMHHPTAMKQTSTPPVIKPEEPYETQQLGTGSLKGLFDNFVATYGTIGAPAYVGGDGEDGTASGFFLDSENRDQGSCYGPASIYQELISPAIGSKVHFLALYSLSHCLTDIVDVLYSESNDKGGVGKLFLYTTLTPVLFPYLKERRQFNAPAFEASSEILLKIALGGERHRGFIPTTLIHQPSIFKLIRKDVWDLFTDPNFFRTDHVDGLLALGKVLNYLISTEPSYFKEILSHLSPINTSNSSIMQMFTRADAENKLKISWLKKLAFIVYCGTFNQYEKNIPEIQEKLVEYVTHSGLPCSPPSPSEENNDPSASADDTDPVVNLSSQYTHYDNISRGSEVLACSFLCFRVLLIRVSNVRLSSLWPVVLNESFRILREIWGSLKPLALKLDPLFLLTHPPKVWNGSEADQATLVGKVFAMDIGTELSRYGGDDRPNMTKTTTTPSKYIPRRRSSFRTATPDIAVMRRTPPLGSDRSQLAKIRAPRPNSLPVSPTMMLVHQVRDKASPGPLTANQSYHSQPFEPRLLNIPSTDTLGSTNDRTSVITTKMDCPEALELASKILGDDPRAASLFPPSVVELLLSLCRLLDLAFVLPPDTSPYFQSYVWSFINYECYVKPRYSSQPDTRDHLTSPATEALGYSEPIGNTPVRDSKVSWHPSHDTRHELETGDSALPSSRYKSTPLQKIADLVSSLANLRDGIGNLPRNGVDVAGLDGNLSFDSSTPQASQILNGLALKGITHASKLYELAPFFDKIACSWRSSEMAPPPSREFAYSAYGLTNSPQLRETGSLRQEKNSKFPFIPDIEAYLLEDFREGYEPNE